MQALRNCAGHLLIIILCQANDAIFSLLSYPSSPPPPPPSLSCGGDDSDEEGFLDGDDCSEVVADSDGLGFSDCGDEYSEGKSD